MAYVTTRNAKKQLEVSEATLRRWGDEGRIQCIRSPGGQRLYAINTFFTNQQVQSDSKQQICYCRVSSVGQKDDLQRQVSYMQEKFPNHRIITDIGSGINFKRKGLRTILELASQGLVSQVVVAYRDRMCRFAFELIEWFLHIHGVKLLVLNQNMDASGQSEDLLAIVNVFNCRVNGRRKYKACGNEEANTEGVS